MVSIKYIFFIVLFAFSFSLFAQKENNVTQGESFIVSKNTIGSVIKTPLSKSTVNLKKNISSLPLPALDLNNLRNNAYNKSKQQHIKSIEFAKPFLLQADFMQIASFEETIYQGQRYRIYRLLVDSPNALSLNFGFQSFFLPQSASLFFYSINGEQLYGPVTAKDNDVHGQYWTPAIATNKVMIELNVAISEIEQVKLQFASANQGFIDVFNLNKELASLKSGSCNIDVVCQAGDSWRDQIQSVALYQLNGFRACSGGAINNTGNISRLFLTADHCNISSQNVASMVVLWNFQNSFCRVNVGGVGDAQVDYVNSGAQLVANNVATDMTLVRLDDPIAYNVNAYMAGWNRSFAAPTSAVAIHHPSVLEKRISFENDVTQITSYLGGAGSGSTHIRVIDWDLGTTEPGSSGSPLFDQNKLVVGQLHGGFAACGNNESDYYGRLSVSWNGSGTPATRLRDWLDPINAGSVTLQGRYYNSIFQADSSEPDNVNNESNLLFVNGASSQHSIHNPQDIDWFRFTVEGEEAQEIIINTAGSNGDTVILLYDVNGNLIAQDDDSGSGLFSQIQQSLAPATYFIAVVGINSRGEREAVEAYNISVRTINLSGCDFFIIPTGNTTGSAVVCL